MRQPPNATIATTSNTVSPSFVGIDDLSVCFVALCIDRSHKIIIITHDLSHVAPYQVQVAQEKVLLEGTSK